MSRISVPTPSVNQKNILDSELTLSLTDNEPFYHSRIPLFSITISAQTVIKAKNTARITLSIIHKTQQLNIQSSGLEPLKS